MTTGSSLLRPRDTDAVRAELRRIGTEGAVPVMFGGEVHDDVLLLTEFHGTRTRLLRGLVVRSTFGLGGASMVSGQPLAVADYRHAPSITHDYDVPVISEGIRSILAVPVVVDGLARAVLYGAYRSSEPFSGRAADLMVTSARRLADELAIRDEVDRRLRLQQAEPAVTSINAEHIRQVHAELRRLAAGGASVAPEKLGELADRLATAMAGGPAAAGGLSPRELDVLAQIALGCTNTEAAQRLSLKPETVKSYLRSAATKLGTHTRHEAVSKARQLRLIP
ncbi:helix-turn-helix transcriptional regulator [Mycobacterium sp. CBMA293]|uniref:LuxR C-terminal-related transcriptional regulator n=1 Tax=unclassified Mycolicibacterium TaxID=2636767 RepID=UPI00132B576E|nr:MULTISPECIES: LuxR C-terminal-related transcriptional regulator [unclassified Mycolicibacterium]MUL48876.1 helix-turn-helix transcriptional regulator [Mycolicibacterium sp. CBMA 360]MUL96872.1 helix-turn-helix transcriptional regulator [Mycolicibacterium sp. CBMA 230]MUM31550.1 helix-turn-helix transcriptional regulator [Mycolicibacterium sp. CBMA 361]MUL62487.1 helix-turn-helix transcriptional regulator [Mycolicibacterium sp. CBMA 335]MUL74178.1 helix-turn-helix transcriptional regulator [